MTNYLPFPFSKTNLSIKASYSRAHIGTGTGKTLQTEAVQVINCLILLEGNGESSEEVCTAM